MFSNEQLHKHSSGAVRSRKTSLRYTATLLAATLTMLGVTAPAMAQSVTQVEFDGSKSRVNLSGRLRTLNQAISSATCEVNSNDNPAARARLYEASIGFGKIIKALRESDVGIGVPTPERKPRILAKIWAIEQEWVKIKFAANKILADVRISEYTNVISGKTDLMSELLDELVAEVIAQYSNPAEMLTGDALRINVAGRQRKLAEQMTKEICGIATEQQKFGQLEDLQATFDLFEKSLAALEEGMPHAGIAPPPNEWVEGKLIEVRIKWLHARYKAIEAALAQEDLSKKYNQFLALRKEMNNVVTLYMTSTLGQDQAYRKPLTKFADEVLSKWLEDEELLAAVRTQNAANKDLKQTEIFASDRQWQSELHSAGEKPLINSLLRRPLSNWLFENQVESSGLITEVIVMDNKGVNVGQSGITTDYWQGDEDKWKETFLKPNTGMHISDVAFDQSTGFFQTQLSMPIKDPANGQTIGAVSFGINVQAFL